MSGHGYAAVPTWAPDGRRLAFLRAEEDRPNVWNLWLLELDTGETTRLTSHRYGQVWAGAWFPDGRRIAYSHEDHLILLGTRLRALDELRVAAAWPPGAHACRLARRWLDHVPGVSRRRLAARSRLRLDAARARRSVRRGVHLGAGWPPCRVPQSKGRRLGPVDDGGALVFCRCHAAAHHIERARMSSPLAAVRLSIASEGSSSTADPSVDTSSPLRRHVSWMASA